MSREFVPGYGPAIGGEGSARLEGVRQGTNAAARNCAAGLTGEVLAAAERVTVRTRAANENVLVSVSATRINALLNGFGRYRFLVDGVAAGTERSGPRGSDLEVVSFSELIQIAAPGDHEISFQVTAVNGQETVAAQSKLIVHANEFAAS